MNKVVDSTFGEMEYKHGWVKKQKLMLWGTVRDIKIKASAYTGEEILQLQRDSYKKFSESVAAISGRSLEVVADYLKKNYQKSDYESVKELVIPRSILFKRDGSYGILCDFALDEEHGLVICVSPKEEVGVQDIFL
ncbi:MAG TPA: hypothetical protein GXZ67_07695 [Clostridiaceae bacterium]|nr:hypothetical protein [Clostridiaceae bacterium]